MKMPKHANGKIDRRYSINREFCGYEGRVYVLRFCDDWVDQFPNREDAIKAAHEHQAKRMAAV